MKHNKINSEINFLQYLFIYNYILNHSYKLNAFYSSIYYWIKGIIEPNKIEVQKFPHTTTTKTMLHEGSVLAVLSPYPTVVIVITKYQTISTHSSNA